MNLTNLVAVDRVRSNAEARARDFFYPFTFDQLAEFAGALEAGEALERFVCNGPVEEVLRAFAYSTVIRELCRRAELTAMEE